MGSENAQATNRIVNRSETEMDQIVPFCKYSARRPAWCSVRHRSIVVWLIVALVMALILQSCNPTGRGQVPNPYFPIDFGRQWKLVSTNDSKNSLSVTVTDSILVHGQWFMVLENLYSSLPSSKTNPRRVCVAAVSPFKVEVVPSRQLSNGKVYNTTDSTFTMYDFRAEVGKAWFIPRAILDDYFSKDSAPIRVVVQSTDDSVRIGEVWLRDCITFRFEIGNREFVETYAQGVGLVCRGWTEMFTLVDEKTVPK